MLAPCSKALSENQLPLHLLHLTDQLRFSCGSALTNQTSSPDFCTGGWVGIVLGFRSVEACINQKATKKHDPGLSSAWITCRQGDPALSQGQGSKQFAGNHHHGQASQELIGPGWGQATNVLG